MGAAESHTAKKQVNVDEAKAPRPRPALFAPRRRRRIAARVPPQTLAPTQEFFSAKLVVGGDDKPETLLPISYWKEASEDEEATATFAYYCAVGRRVFSLAPSTTPRRRRRGETRPARRNRASSSRSSARYCARRRTACRTGLESTSTAASPTRSTRRRPSRAVWESTSVSRARVISRR